METSNVKKQTTEELQLPTILIPSLDVNDVIICVSKY